jgi:hypothetical protein
MSSCGTLPSLAFINKCKKLEEFRFVNTKIADNDMTPLLRLKSVGFNNRRTYSHTNEEIDRLIEMRLAV